MNSNPLVHNIYLVRHGDVDIAPDICYGQFDCSVNSQTFPTESKKLINHFANGLLDNGNNRIITSPLARCFLMAEKMQMEIKGLDDLVCNDGFREIHFGDWEGESWSKIDRELIDSWNNNFLSFTFPNGESAQTFYLRIVQAWRTLLKELANCGEQQNVIVISHAGVIRGILADFLQVPLKHSLSLKVDKLSVSHISYVPEQESLSRCQLMNLPIN